MQNKSVTAGFVKSVLEEYGNWQFNGKIEQPSENDINIYVAIMNNNVDQVFTSSSFKLNDKNQFVATLEPNNKEYEKILNKAILQKINESISLKDEEKYEESKIAIETAYKNWLNLQEIESEISRKGGADELKKLTVLNSIDNSLADDMLNSSWEVLSTKFKKVSSKFGDLANKVVNFFS